MDPQIRFDDGAAYEAFMGRWSRLVGEPFLDWLAPSNGLRWIDVGCGNGAFTELVVERCSPSHVRGIDPSDAQLAFARSRLQGRPASFDEGDAMALPYAGAAFDAAVMALVIFFVPDPARGVAEMARVVRPGGSVSAYAWDILGGGFPFAALQAELDAMAAKLGLGHVLAIPLSALRGDMVVERGDRLGWYRGPTLLEHLESADLSPLADRPLRFPVQLVSRPGRADAYVRGYMGRIESGVVRVGDRVVVLPAGRETTVTAIVTLDGALQAAVAPQSVTLLLADDIDISRGDLIAPAGARPRATRQFDAMVCWMDANPMDPRGRYLLKHTTRTTVALVDAVTTKLDIATLETRDAAGAPLAMNEIGRVRFRTRDPLMVDAYVDDRATGAFIVIDEVTNHTVAAGMVEAA